MEIFTKKILTASAALAVGLSAAAQTPATWTMSDYDFAGTHRTTPVIADFTNNGHMDFFYGGQGCESQGIGFWQVMSNFYPSDGNGSWTADTYLRKQKVDESGNPVTTPRLDNDGNPVLDDNGGPIMDPVMENIFPNSGLRGNSLSKYYAFDYNNDGLVDLLMYGQKEWDALNLGDLDNYVLLYKNVGNGKFELVDFEFPSMSASVFNYPIAVGVSASHI